MVLATAIPDLQAVASSPAAQTVILSNQALSAIVARSAGLAPFIAPALAMNTVMINRQTLPGSQGINATATNTGLNSTSQAAVSISFTLALPPAAKPSR